MGYKQCKKQWEPVICSQTWQRWKPTFYRCLEMIEMKCYTGKKATSKLSKSLHSAWFSSPHTLLHITSPSAPLRSYSAVASWTFCSRLEASGETGPKKDVHILIWRNPQTEKKVLCLFNLHWNLSLIRPNQTQALISSSASLLTWELAKDDQTPEEISDMKIKTNKQQNLIGKRCNERMKTNFQKSAGT